MLPADSTRSGSTATAKSNRSSATELDDMTIPIEDDDDTEVTMNHEKAKAKKAEIKELWSTNIWIHVNVINVSFTDLCKSKIT